jgi:hypothetical protein
MKRWVSKGPLITGLAILVLVGMYVLPFVVHEDPYGEVPIPGSATVHLPAGEVDLTLRSREWSLEGRPVPPLSIQISGPDGRLQAEVAENRRTKYFTSEDTWVRLWVVHVEREGDYHIAIDGEVYGPYRPWLTFHHMGNHVVGVLILVGAIVSSVAFSVTIVIGGFWLAAMLCGLCAGLLTAREHRSCP